MPDPTEVATDPDLSDQERADQGLPAFVDSIYLALSEELNRMGGDALAIECCTAGWLAMVTS